MSFHELDSLITRVGKNCKIILCGDYRQSDLTLVQEKKGLQQFLEVLNSVKKFKRFEFGIDDIVRSDIVKDYIISKTELGYV
jgi:phosphate starvation-inducible protein PhoH